MAETIYAIDPGTEQSALIAFNSESQQVLHRRILPNTEVLGFLESEFDGHKALNPLVIEMVACYGMAVGKEVFETVYWIGRFAQAWGDNHHRLYRQDIKLHLCNSVRAKDANVRQALIDRFGPGKRKAIGLKKTPGPLYGIKSHLWAALAVAVTYSDQRAAKAA